VSGGQQIEEFQNPGVLSTGNSVFQGQGACVTYQFDGFGAWRIVSSA
jgi:hypothetical protein